MLNLVSLLPHCKKDNKVESKDSKGATLNELVELKSCSSCLFFEVPCHFCCTVSVALQIQLLKCSGCYFVLTYHKILSESIKTMPHINVD